jgi:murein tripeptide amidase MpaA
MLEGLVKALTEDTPRAQFLRRNVKFRVVPMLNPDGVVAGNYRTGYTGKDFNRLFTCPDEELHPEVHSLKEEVAKMKKLHGRDLLMFLDLHGHSVKKNVFMYGPEFSIT